MGYHIFQDNVRFFLSVKHKDAALAAIKALDPVTYYANSTFPRDAFPFVNTKIYQEATSLEEALEEWRWLAKTDSAGNIVDLEFTGEKSGADEVLFSAIAQYITVPSDIEMHGEDAARWIWQFDDGKLKTLRGMHIWITDYPKESEED